jgi:hypothetical protein
MVERLDYKRAGLALIVVAGMVMSAALVLASPAAGQGNPPSEECASADPLWNGDYWKIQVNDGSLGSIEAEPDDGIITLNADGSWTNNHDSDVFRIILKVGQGVGSDVVHEPPVNPIDLNLNGLSHVTFCFTDPPTTTTTVEETTTTAVEETTTTAAEETTTTVAEETTTTVEILETTLTTAPAETTSSSVADTVLGTEVLPFTGVESEWTFWLATILALTGGLLVYGAKRAED